jgi:hypothetical protein
MPCNSGLIESAKGVELTSGSLLVISKIAPDLLTPVSISLANTGLNDATLDQSSDVAVIQAFFQNAENVGFFSSVDQEAYNTTVIEDSTLSLIAQLIDQNAEHSVINLYEINYLLMSQQ